MRCAPSDPCGAIPEVQAFPVSTHTPKRESPMAAWRGGQGPKQKLPQRLTREEAAALIAQPNRRYPTGIRNRALLRLLYRSGLRCSEALNLRLRDVDLARGEIRVWQGKGERDRRVWIDDATIEMLALWRHRRPKSEWFFCTLHGGKLDDRYVRRMT